jgi:hypothetical protein
MCLERIAVSITPHAEALMTAETPPDWAYKAFLRTIFFMAVSAAGKGAEEGGGQE